MIKKNLIESIANLGAKIVPGSGAGGFEVGSKFDQVKHALEGAVLWNRAETPVLSDAIANESGWLLCGTDNAKGIISSSGRMYFYGRGALELHFDDADVLNWIAVGPGYLGVAFDSIGIGTPLQHVVRHFAIEYDAADELHFAVLEGEEIGICFEAEGASLEVSPNQLIHRIIVS